MGETSDGSSRAAQGAPLNMDDTSADDPGGNPGLLSRVMSVFSGQGQPDDGREANGSTVPALGSAPPSLRNLSSMRVEEVMIPRAEIVAVADEMAKDDLVEIFRQSGLTRLPVYQGTLDTPIGMVHLKDFALSHGFNGNGGAFDMRAMLRPLLFAPPSMPIGTLLQKMQTDRVHMALVIDEYGGVDGLATIEDLIEQVIGEIEDEHDVAEGRFWTVEKPGCYLAQAKTPLDDFEAEVGKKLTTEADDEEVDTLGGLVFMLAGRVPARGEVIPHPDDVDFEVVDADPRRIKRLRVRVGGAPRG